MNITHIAVLLTNDLQVNDSSLRLFTPIRQLLFPVESRDDFNTDMFVYEQGEKVYIRHPECTDLDGLGNPLKSLSWTEFILAFCEDKFIEFRKAVSENLGHQLGDELMVMPFEKIDSLGTLYEVDEHSIERTLLKHLYSGPHVFEHNKECHIATIPAENTGGNDVDIYEKRCPAESYRLDINPTGSELPIEVRSTDSFEVVHSLAMSISEGLTKIIIP